MYNHLKKSFRLFIANFNVCDFILILLFFSSIGATPTMEPLPEFIEDIKNVTVTAGRDVKLTCTVENIGTYKVSNFFVSVRVQTTEC